MTDDIFNTAYQMLFSSYQDELVASASHEVNKREYLYCKIQVLSDVAKELGGMVSHAQSITAREREMERLANGYESTDGDLDDY